MSLEIREHLADVRNKLLRLVVRVVISGLVLDSYDIELIKGLDLLRDLSACGASVDLDKIFLKASEHCVELLAGDPSRRLVLKKHSLCDLLTDLNDRVKRGERILEDHSDLVASDLVHFLLVYLEKVLTVEEDLSALNDRVTCKNTEDRLSGYGFSRARLTNDSESLALFNIKGNIANSLYRTALRTEGDLQIINFKNLTHRSILHTAQRRVKCITKSVTEQVEAYHQK